LDLTQPFSQWLITQVGLAGIASVALWLMSRFFNQMVTVTALLVDVATKSAAAIATSTELQRQLVELLSDLKPIMQGCIVAQQLSRGGRGPKEERATNESG
jgi:hypothetical protein